MASRQYRRLTVKDVEKRKTVPGKHADGDGLYLTVTGELVPSWAYRYARDGEEHWAGLGPLRDLTLAQAREAAHRCRQLLREGIDPIEQRRAARLAKALQAARTQTFEACTQSYIESHQAGWRNAEHHRQWARTMDTYVHPVIGQLPISAIDTALVMRVLEPIWAVKPETASRIRGRIEAVLGWATARGYRSSDNPARWKGHLENLLSSRRDVQPVVHLAALPYVQISSFMVKLRAREGIAERALEFLILTTARTGEVIYARWDEINLAERLWIVPAERMKARRQHRVPLSDATTAIIEQMAAVKSSDFVFPGTQEGRPLGKMALSLVLQRIHSGATVHGFRSAFSDWCAEQTNTPSEVREMALAHSVGNKVEEAYRRGDLFKKRRDLAEAWARYCTAPTPVGEIIAFAARG